MVLLVLDGVGCQPDLDFGLVPAVGLEDRVDVPLEVDELGLEEPEGVEFVLVALGRIGMKGCYDEG